jgi:hypothetical protein
MLVCVRRSGDLDTDVSETVVLRAGTAVFYPAGSLAAKQEPQHA